MSRGWAHALHAVSLSLPPPDAEADEALVAQTCAEVVCSARDAARAASSAASGPSRRRGAAIPPLSIRRPAKAGLGGRMARAVRLRALRLRSELLLEFEEVEALWFLLKEHSVLIQGEAPPPAPDGTQPPRQPDQELIDYHSFCEVAARAAELWGAKCAALLAPSTFLKFPADDHGRVSALAIFSYAMRGVSATQTRIHLTFHAEDANFITRGELREYLSSMVDALPALQGMDEAFRETYLDIAMAHFFFLHDAHNRGRVRIAELVASPALNEFFELRSAAQGEAPPQAVLARNWFSLEATTRLQRSFMELDRDMNGTLSIRELLQYSGGNLTQMFVKRVFEAHVAKQKPGRYGPNVSEMEFPAFVDFVLALANKRHARGLAYFFRVFDVGAKGHLTRADLHSFFREVLVKWTEAGNYEINADDVEDEVVDMINPADPARITLRDLQRCGNGEQVVNILSDVAGFWAYDSRESLVQQQ